MRCRTCEYPLWNLTADACPECGESFKPNEYRFVPNSVSFCCPHCDQSYYGTDVNGHLEPTHFECITCARPVHMDEMVLRPATNVTEAQTRPVRMPWLERESGSRLSSWFSTIGMALIRPQRLMGAVPMNASSLQAWWFALTCALAVAALSFLPALMFMAVPLFAAAPGTLNPGRIAGLMTGMAAGGTLAGFLFTGAYILVWAAFTHGILMVSGPRAGGFGRTLQAILYSSGANIVTIVPCLGAMGGWAWWTVSAVLMVLEGQRVKGLRATIAVIAFPILSTFLLIGLYAALIYGSLVAAKSSATAVRMQAQVPVIASVIDDYRRQHGAYPAHALLLTADDGVQPGDFLANDWSTTRGDVSFGTFTLDDYQREGPERRRETLAAYVEGLPEAVVAHRVGDFVFTYHGLDPEYERAHPEVWRVIMAAEPVANPNGAKAGWVVSSPSEVVYIDARDRMGALQLQNALRRAAGLPPLVDPATVRSDAPHMATK